MQIISNLMVLHSSAYFESQYFGGEIKHGLLYTLQLLTSAVIHPYTQKRQSKILPTSETQLHEELINNKI